MIDILASIKIEELKRYNLFKLEDIAKHLGIWDSFPEEEKTKISSIGKPLLNKDITDEEFTLLLKNPDFDNYYEDNLVYGEITNKGIFKISEYLNNFTGNFYDIGSGNGKVIFQMSLISNFIKFTGIEILEIRHLYAKKIQNELGFDNVNLICGDVLDFDISDANVIFMNDVMFSKELQESINNKIPKDCYYFSFQDNQNDELIDSILIDISWSEIKFPIKFYRKC